MLVHERFALAPFERVDVLPLVRSLDQFVVGMLDPHDRDIGGPGLDHDDGVERLGRLPECAQSDLAPDPPPGSSTSHLGSDLRCDAGRSGGAAGAEHDVVDVV